MKKKNSINKEIKIKKTKTKDVKNKDNKKYILVRRDNEVDIYFELRELFFNKMKPKKLTEKSFKLYEMYSDILINIIFLKCRYQEKTESIIKQFFNKYMNNLSEIIKRNTIF